MDPSGDSIAIRVVIIIILLGLSAFFSSSETALTTVNKIRIRTLAEGGSKSAQWVMKLSENQGKMLSAILIGNNVVNLSASSMLTVLVTEIFGNKAAGAVAPAAKAARAYSFRPARQPRRRFETERRRRRE